MKNEHGEEAYTQFLTSCLRQLGYIVQENELFNAAMRTYDLDIVSMIADKQKKVCRFAPRKLLAEFRRSLLQDPAEYVPFIQQLRAKEPLEYRHYAICIELKDWPQALRHILTVSDRFDECLEHIKAHNLYADALELIPGAEKYSVCVFAKRKTSTYKSF